MVLLPVYFNTPMNLSTHFTLEELTFSDAAIRKGFDNEPTVEIKNNLILLCENVLEPIKELVGHSISVTSGYRCILVNRAIGGAKNSQHIKGQAADIRVKELMVEDLFQLIKKSPIPYDQVIEEYDSWVHVSYAPNPRRQSLRAIKVDKKTMYVSDEN
jgi:zinc D-Ala-D-Ala carboxypeptidase